MVNSLNADILAKIMGDVRLEKGKSQKDMAKRLHKSIGTIQNWESGYSCPSVMDMLYWFDALGVNPLRYILNFVHPDVYHNLTEKDSLQTIKKGLIQYIDGIATEGEIRKLAYCMFGNTGSSWHSQMDMICALNHLPIHDRINIAENIFNLYEIEEFKGNLRGTNHVLPNMQELRNAIELCKEAVYSNKDDYGN